MNQSTLALSQFKHQVLSFFRASARTLPWRETENPYHILVSEIMLQQTQVSRVITKYLEFIKVFPDFKTLASAPVSQVLRNWQGLGYNRRALYLKRIAEKAVKEHQGVLPKDAQTLNTFPGIGPATAAAICVYAYNQPQVFIETNIRTVFIHHFFPNQNAISDSELLPFVEKTVDRKNPRTWYWALMDYGSFLKTTVGNANQRSTYYTKQSPFKTSNRRIRGLIIKTLAQNTQCTASKLAQALNVPLVKIKSNLRVLQKEGFLKNKNGSFGLAK